GQRRLPPRRARRARAGPGPRSAVPTPGRIETGPGAGGRRGRGGNGRRPWLRGALDDARELGRIPPMPAAHIAGNAPDVAAGAHRAAVRRACPKDLVLAGEVPAREVSTHLPVRIREQGPGLSARP